jgi:hypothetical protein
VRFTQENFMQFLASVDRPRCGRNRLAGLLSFIVVVLVSAQLYATVNSGEIVPSSVTATINSGFDPVNGVSITFRWTTVHASNSIVIIENSTDYAGANNTPTRQVTNSTLTTTHVVTVDHFPAYSTYATWGYYVASEQSNGTWATYPGPATNGGTYLTFTLPTSPTNPNGPTVFTLWPIGGQNVYQGDSTQSPACTPASKSSRECNDLYIALQANLLSGPTSRMVQMENVAITDLDTGQQVTNNSISPQYLCDLAAPSNPPPSNWDGDYVPGANCSNGTLASINTTLRLRVNSQAVPGHYQFKGNFQATYGGVNYGNPVAVAYNFTVLPTAAFASKTPTTFPAISGVSTWQNNMANPNPYNGSGYPYRSAEFWCTNNTDTNPWWSLDNGNFTGGFDFPSSDYFLPWNYDGGRVYQQIADYDYNTTGMFGYQDIQVRDGWKRCAQLAMEPYKDTVIATQASIVQEPNQFAFGMAMNHMRTGDPMMQQAVNFLAQNPTYLKYYAGSAYARSSRVNAYMFDDRLAAEILGTPRDVAFTLRSVDVMLGDLDQSYNLNFTNPNQQSYDVHPFLIGTIMEALIDYYELDLSEGNTPDARIPLEIKKVLDWWYTTQYINSTHTLAYQPYDVPMNPTLVSGLYSATELNDLVAPAFAWYWYRSNNLSYMFRGDDLFSNVFDSAGGPGGGLGSGWTWSVKEFNQVYKWSFDYVSWRSGQNSDGSSPVIPSVLAAANPCENQSSPCSAPWVDYTTPVQMSWSAATSNWRFPTVNPVITAPVVNGTTVTFTFNTFKPATTVVYYGTATPGTCNLNNPAPPFCMQPFPNFDFVQMLTASYTNQTPAVVAVKNNNTTDQWDQVGSPNIWSTTVTITGLAPKTTYHFRPYVVDNNGNAAAYKDQTFTTVSAK